MTRKTTFFEGWSWFMFNNLGLALGMALEIYTSVRKKLNLKSVELKLEKLVGFFFALPILNKVKIVWDKFRLKSVMSYNSFNVIYVVFCFGCLKEYSGEIFVGKTKWRKPEYMHNINNDLSIKNLKLKSYANFLKSFCQNTSIFWHNNVLLIQI